MKMTKMIYPLAFALAITLASTGCHNRQVKVTPIPGQNRQGLTDVNPNTLPPPPIYNPDTDPNKRDGSIPLAPDGEFDNMLKDPAALAAYTIHFAFDSSAIKASEKANLESVAAALKGDANTKLLIEGN